MKRISPPNVGCRGHAGGDAGDGSAGGELGFEATWAEDFGDVIFVDNVRGGARLLVNDFEDVFAEATTPLVDFSELETMSAATGRGPRSRCCGSRFAHAGFVRVGFDDPGEGVVFEADLFGGETMSFELAGNEIGFGDAELIGLGVAGDFDHFHAVAEGAGDCVHGVGGGDEEDAREVERDIEIMIGKGVVLSGIENFEHGACLRGRRGNRAHFVDFVEHHDGIFGAGLAELGDDSAGHGTDVGAAMAADVGFIADAAESDTDEFSAHGFCDGFAERGFAHAGGTHKAEGSRRRPRV